MTRLNFILEIPVSVSPTFHTSGLSHSWAIHVEFVSAPLYHGDPGDLQAPNIPEAAEAATVPKAFVQPLMKVLSNDDRGKIALAVPSLVGDAFDCRIPIELLPTNQDLAGMEAGFSLPPGVVFVLPTIQTH
jgi:hypothetical protein